MPRVDETAATGRVSTDVGEPWTPGTSVSTNVWPLKLMYLVPMSWRFRPWKVGLKKRRSYRHWLPFFVTVCDEFSEFAGKFDVKQKKTFAFFLVSINLQTSYNLTTTLRSFCCIVFFCPFNWQVYSKGAMGFSDSLIGECKFDLEAGRSGG